MPHLGYPDFVSRFALDPLATKIHVFTFAEGFLARLAHDLRLTVGHLDLTADRAAAGEACVRGSISLSAVRVDGVMKGGALRADVLSEKDKEEILEKMREEVFGGAAPDSQLGFEGTLAGKAFAGTISAPNGRSTSVTCQVSGASGEGSETVRGTIELSLRGLAGRDIKGPLGAFRIADTVRVDFDATFCLLP